MTSHYHYPSTSRVLVPGCKMLLGAFYTLLLFTYTDYKTIFLPITIFSVVAAPPASLTHFSQTVIWIWFHLLQCNVSNQCKSVAEDAVNRSWRPIPSGRITPDQARNLRSAVFLVCLVLSSTHGLDIVIISIWLTITTVVYDDVRLAGHWLGKNVCNVSGYASFELGASKLMGRTSHLDGIARLSLLLSTSIILSTIQMQDFPDVLGDLVLGRRTLPIAFPETSRRITVVMMLAWSAILAFIWDLGLGSSSLFIALGAWIAWRNWKLRTTEEDKRTYRIYNLWLFCAHLLPLNARYGVLNW